MEQKIAYYLDEINKLQNGEYVNPVSVEIDPSNVCNAKCYWCMFSEYREKSQAMLSWDVYLKLIYELNHLGVKSITFTGGGEPLVNRKFNDMVQVAKGLGLEVGLVTNGILLHKLKFPDQFKFIRVSLDASNPEMYLNTKGVDRFDQVIENIQMTLKKNKTVGLSYVVGPTNNTNLDQAEEMAHELGVAYIQIKPAYIENRIFTDYKLPSGKEVIGTKRYKRAEKINCIIAHLTGIVTADSGVYYCCQGRGKMNFYLGSVSNESFESIWRRRLSYDNIRLTQCPPCRYASYANYFKTLIDEGDMFFEHRYFL